MFTKIILDTSVTFQELEASMKFENVTLGRQAGNLVSDIDNIPLVRTTTKYKLPNQPFQNTHITLSKLLGTPTNNAMVEIYDSRYKSMGYHSDMALDLAEGSNICIFSCYCTSDGEKPTLRKLQIKNKDSNDSNDFLEIEMDHNSLITFSVDTNSKYLHRIVLDSNNDSEDKHNTQWLGVTFRQSKTFVQFKNKVPYFGGNEGVNELTMASDVEIKEFYKSRSQENKLVKYVYPVFSFTISEGDLIDPKKIV